MLISSTCIAGHDHHCRKVFTNFNEESHHVEELLDVDAAVAVLVKQVEHLTMMDLGVDDDDDDDGHYTCQVSMVNLRIMILLKTMMTMMIKMTLKTWPRLSSVLPSQKR